MIKATSSSLVIFLQERLRKDRKLFKVYKFRSIYRGSERIVKDMEDDARTTAMGRFYPLDEDRRDPQYLNVQKCRMSLIGPQPERDAFLLDSDEGISKRLNMRPGMTGLTQVRGNIYISLADRYRLDVYYMENSACGWISGNWYEWCGCGDAGERRYKDCPLVIGLSSTAQPKEEEMALK